MCAYTNKNVNIIINESTILLVVSIIFHKIDK